MRPSNRVKFAVLLLVGVVAGLAAGRPAGAALSVRPMKSPDTVVMTVYRSGNLTLMEEHRSLVLKEGVNRLQFSWEERRIDPSSLQLQFRGSTGSFHVKETSYPAGEDSSVVWVIESQKTLRTTAVVSYFFRGVEVAPVYNFLSGQNEETGRLNGRFQVSNRTDETLKPTRLRVLIGEVQLLESIEEIIRRWSRSRPASDESRTPATTLDRSGARRESIRQSKALMSASAQRSVPSATVASEYQLITLESAPAIPARATTFLPFLNRSGIRYRKQYEALVYDDETALTTVTTIPNTRANQLGESVLPEGPINLLTRSNRGAPAWEGTTTLAYASTGDSVTVERSGAGSLEVTKTVLSRRKHGFEFGEDKNLQGWRETRGESITVTNYRQEPVTVTVYRDFERSYWTMLKASDPYRKVSPSRVAFTVRVEPETSRSVRYTYRLPFGSLR